jgi:Xaa-Pro aminopeptidase
MRTIKTPAEIAHIRTACNIAEEAFANGVRVLRPGITEAEAAAAFRIGLASCLGDHHDVTRCDGFTCCMSGPNSGHASGTYCRSRTRRLKEGDLVIVRCHCYADGYWADIARTYHIGPVDAVKKRMLEAVLAARQAVLDALRPGMKAGELDEIARRTIDAHGFVSFIKHPTGHGTGFGALEHTARPRLHAKSADVIEEGMVLKVEPGIYIEGHGGVRNADMVAVTASGHDLLTNFHRSFDELTV